MAWFQQITRRLQLLADPRCELCLEPTSAHRFLCQHCEAALPRYGQRCDCCALPLPAGQSRCGRCLSRLPAYDCIHTPFLYRPPVSDLIKQLKFGRRLHLAPLLGGLLAEYIETRLESLPDVLIPVPLHRRRLAERGFNQSQELARVLHRALAVPLDSGRVIRRRHTEAQSGLKLEQRRRNLSGAFAVKDGAMPRHVLIVDDVVTSGFTVDTLSRLLRRHGVQRIEVAALARAER